MRQDFLGGERKQSLSSNLAKHSLAMFQREYKGLLSDDRDSRITFSYPTLGDIKSRAMWIRNKLNKLFIRVYLLSKATHRSSKGSPCALPAPAHHSVESFHFIPHSHLSLCLPPTLRSPTAPVVTSWHGPSPHFQLRALWLLISVKPKPR